MDGNKTRFAQLQTAQKKLLRVAAEQVFPGGAFSMFAAESLRAVRYEETREEKL
jgi:hypothetical protein